MLQALLSLTKSAEPKRLVRQWRNRRKVCEEQSGDEVSDWQSARQACAVTSQRNRRSTSAGKPGHSKSESRYFSAVREKRLVQLDRADRHIGEDPEMGKTERDVCLFHEDDNDQSAYPCPSHLIDRGGDELEDLMMLPCWVWFDMEAPEASERDGLDTIATTEQHLRTLARSEVRIESPRETSANSKFLNTRVGTQKVEGEFAVRDVTKLTDAAGRPTKVGKRDRAKLMGQFGVWSEQKAS